MMQAHAAAENMIELKATGKITADDYDQVLPVFDRTLERSDRVRVLADLSEMDGMTPAGLKEDLKESMSRIGDRDRLERVAVLAEGAMLRGWAKAGGALVPGIDIRAFESGERDQALAWLEGADVPD